MQYKGQQPINTLRKQGKGSEMAIKEKAEQLIRSLSIPRSTKGYHELTSQLTIREYLSPWDFIEIWNNMDWMSQDGLEGK